MTDLGFSDCGICGDNKVVSDEKEKAKVCKPENMGKKVSYLDASNVMKEEPC